MIRKLPLSLILLHSSDVHFLMAQSQCRRSIGDKFSPEVVVENKESLINRSNNPNKSGAVTLSEIFLKIFTRFCRKIVR